MTNIQATVWRRALPVMSLVICHQYHPGYNVLSALVTTWSRPQLSDQVWAPVLSPSPPMKAAEGYCLRTESITWGSFIITTFIKVPDERSQEDFLSTHYTYKLLKTEQNGQELCLPIKDLSKGIGFGTQGYLGSFASSMVNGSDSL